MAALIQFANGAPGIKYSIDKQTITIGRGTSGNDICLPCAFCSKHHALIEAVPGLQQGQYSFYLQDLDSTNKTFVNDQAVERVKLEDGDLIRIGRTTLKFDASGETTVLEAVEVDNEEPSLTQSRTWSFSRRLSTFGSE